MFTFFLPINWNPTTFFILYFLNYFFFSFDSHSVSILIVSIWISQRKNVCKCERAYVYGMVFVLCTALYMLMHIIKRTFSTSYSLRDLRTLEKNFGRGARWRRNEEKKRLKTNVNVNLEMCKQMMYICHVSRVTFCHPQISFAAIFSHTHKHTATERQNEWINK